MTTRTAPDLILSNGKITIRADSTPDVEAIAIAGGRVVAVGNNDEVLPLADDRTEIRDLQQRRVIPGLIDSHFHAIRAGLSWADEIRWDGVRTLKDALDIIRARAEESPKTAWIPIVGGWHPGQFDERRPPTLAELDDAGGNFAVYAQQGYQCAFLNSVALRAAGYINADGKVIDPVAESDEQGFATGKIVGRPAFKHCLEMAFSTDFEDEVHSTTEMCKDLNALGLTGVIDTGGGARMSPAVYRVIHEVHRRGNLSVRTRLYVHPHGSEEFMELRNALTYLHPGFGDVWLQYTGMGEIPIHKTYDGAGIDGMRMDEATRAELKEATELCLQHNWPLNIHAVKDETLQDILDVWEPLHQQYDLRGRRFSISHADQVSRETLERVKAWDIGITVQDRISIRSQDSADAWGDAIATSPRLRDMVELEIPVGGGTDATVAGPVDPWLSLEWLVTGKQLDNGPSRSPEQCVTKMEALNMYTLGSAWFSFEESTRGALNVDYYADLVVLDRDYFDVPDHEIHSIRPVMTVVGGEVVFEK